MSKHTPGPWDFSWHIQPNGCPTVGHKGLMVCMVAHSAKDPDQKETALADAALIAAAPEMLDALEVAAETFRRYEQSHRAKGTQDGLDKAIANQMLAIRLEAAIAKARGEA